MRRAHAPVKPSPTQPKQASRAAPHLAEVVELDVEVPRQLQHILLPRLRAWGWWCTSGGGHLDV